MQKRSRLESGIEQVVISKGDITLTVISSGAAIQSLKFRGREMVLSVAPELNVLSPCFGQVVGRFANRIKDGRFTLNGKNYLLERNENGNTLHAGASSFGKHQWQVSACEGGDSVTFCYRSPDGDGGFPGNLEVKVCYTVTEDGVRIGYSAESDSDTPLNLINHSYFNLDSEGPVTECELQVSASAYLPMAPDQIPTGEIAPVENTLFDFRKPVRLADRIDRIPTGGYDHCFVLDDGSASLYSPRSGIEMRMTTSMPAVHIYTGNSLYGGKNCGGHGKWGGICFESEQFPDAPNRPEFPSSILRAGEKFTSVTEYRFKAR